MRITGSSLPLLRNCQWWARPEVEAPAFQPTAAMELGTKVHAIIEGVLSGSLDAAILSDATEDAFAMYDAWTAWWESRPLGDGNWRPEQAYAYDPRTDKARTLDAKNRSYSVEQGEIAGTIDAVLVDGKRAVVVDWKTGQDFANLTADASENWQLRL